jgi:hypothetical protein
VLWIFIALKNPSPWSGFEHATFGSSGQHTNHYTTKTTHVLFMVNKVALSRFFSDFFGFTSALHYPTIVSYLLSPPHEVCDSSDQAPHYHTIGRM